LKYKVVQFRYSDEGSLVLTNIYAANVETVALLAFAVWTVVLLLFTVGIYRWSRILTRRVSVNEWRADETQGSAFYQRAMRAHANCVENLPVFAAVIISLNAFQASSTLTAISSVGIVGARLLQSLLHVALPQGVLVASLRFGAFFAQLLLMGVIVFVIVTSAEFLETVRLAMGAA